jgi:dGTPase
VAAAGVETVEEIRGLDRRVATLTPEAKNVNGQLRAFLVNHLYAHPDLVRDREIAVRKLGELFQFLLAHPDRVSAGYRERLKEESLERIVCDYIAGMTDTYFHKIYRELVQA